MALDELRRDLMINLASARTLKETPGIVDNLAFSKICDHLTECLWPFMEAAVDEIDDLDASLAEVAEASGDMLQPETAGVFARIIILGRELAKELKSRADLAPKLLEFEALCSTAEGSLEEITVGQINDDEEGDDDDEGDDDADGK